MSAASTGGTEGSSPASSPASATSLTMAAPKYGTLVPNRIFVGGISANTSEAELTQLFSSYGNVKATKIIADRAGVSKGYGFVTFETEEEAKRLQQESECIVLRERKLNIAPAIKKQPFNRSFDGGSGSPPSVPTSTYYYTNGMGLTYQNGMTFYNPATPAPTTPIPPPTDPATIYQATGVFGPQATGHQTFAPVMYPCPAPSLYMPQQYQYSPVPYEPYYAGTATAGAPQYLYTAGNSQNSTNASGSTSGNGNNGTGGNSQATGPPPPSLSSLPPPPPAHFYAQTAPPPHHHPPVQAAAPPQQVDHLYYSFAAGTHPPPPHGPMGLTDQQLLLYATDTACQQNSSSDSQTAPQEDSRSTSSHSEQPHGETQAASGSATPLVSLMPIKFPMSGRYTNYHPIPIHTANLYSSQSCLNETDECSANQMPCRTIVYHPTTLYIPHAHTPSYHNASGGTSLLPTPPAVPQQLFESSGKSQGLNSKEYTKAGVTSGQGNHLRSQAHGGPMSQQAPFAKAQTLGNSQSYKYTNFDGHPKYSTAAMTPRLPTQYGKRTTVGSTMGSPAYLVAQKSSSYGPAQNLQKPGGSFISGMGSYSPVGFNTPHKGLNANSQSFEYANGRRNLNSSSEQYFDGTTVGLKSNRKNCVPNNCRTVNSTSTAISQSNENYSSSSIISVSGNQDLQISESTTSIEKPASPPPAPYSPMTRPLPTLSPPAPQVQFYAPAQNRYQPSLAPSQHQHQQQQQQQQQQQSNQRRYAIGPSGLAGNRKPAEKYGSGNGNASGGGGNSGGGGSTGSQATMLRQSKYKVNGIMQSSSKVSEDNLGGAGDAPPDIGRMLITPPGTPRAHSTADQNQLSDTCHQMQALSL